MAVADPAGTALIGAAHPDAQITTRAVKLHTHRHVIALRQRIRRKDGAAALPYGPAPRRAVATVVDGRDLRVVETLAPFLPYQQTTGRPPKWLHPVRILVLRNVARSRCSLRSPEGLNPDESPAISGALDRRILRSAKINS